MIKIKSLFFIFYLGCICTLNAQNKGRVLNKVDFENQILTLTLNDGHYLIRPYTNFIVETSFIPAGERFLDTSHAVVLRPEADYVFNETEKYINLISSGLHIVIEKNPFQISYFFRNRQLISEKNGFQKTDSTRSLQFHLSPEETLMGGGSRVLGMNRRGNKLPLYNRAHYGYETHSNQMNFSIPMVLSSKLYALHFDNTYTGVLDLDSAHNNTLTYQTDGGRMTYQVIAANRWEDLTEQYTLLTGRQPLPPVWSFGNFSSRFGYHSQNEVEKTVSHFKKDSIPLDALVIDIYWFGKDIKGHMGNLEFLKDSFPEPDKMMKDLNAQGVKTVLVTEPFILTTSKRWEEAVREGVLATDALGKPYRFDFYFGNSGLVDIYHPLGKKWFWDIYKTLTQRGVSGWWGDLGEPEAHPDALLHLNGPAKAVHNIYGHDWARLIAEGYQKDFPEQRPFILMRAGSSGSQRFGMIPWSGDVSRSWGGLQAQPEIALQMGLQGFAYMHSDLGGFAGGEVFDAELYTRWLQYGVFQPVFRPHAQEHIAPEPVFHDAETKALAKNAIALRYALLPYNYTMAFLNQQNGLPLMRPLFFEEPENKNLFLTADTYFWGRDFLISPILQKGQKLKKIYLPKGSEWIDFYTEKKYSGGSSIQLPTSKNYIPAFVRSGALIPLAEPLLNTVGYPNLNINWHWYADGQQTNHSVALYEDDGSTPDAYQRGLYSITSAETLSGENFYQLKWKTTVGENYTSAEKNGKLIVHQLKKKPKKIDIDGQSVSFDWQPKEKLLTVNINAFNAKEKTVTLWW